MKSPRDKTTMYRLRLLAAIALADPMTAKGALGEDLDACKNRYGDVTRTIMSDNPNGVSKVYVFEMEGLEVRVRFFEEKAAWIRYETPKILNEEGRKMFLELNKGDSEWELVRTERTENEKALYEKVWLMNTEDAKRQAHISQPDSPTTTLGFCTKKAGELLGVYRKE